MKDRVILPVERMLVRDRDTGALLRLVHIDRITFRTWLCNIEDDSWPVPISSARFMEELNSEDARYSISLDDPWLIPEVQMDDSAACARHKARYDLIESLVTGEDAHLLLERRHRRTLISARLKEVESSSSTLKLLIKLYWKRGMTFAALKTDYGNCGAPGERRNPTGKKVGAPRRITPGIGINVTDDIRPMLQVGADYWLTRKQPTLKEAIDRVVGLYFSEEVRNSDNKLVGIKVAEDAKPTLRQLQYFIHTEYPDRIIRRRRYGEKNWDLHERELLGTADGDVQGPGDRFVVDATIADVYLRSQFDRRRIVGRPVIYFVIDVWSRLITGLYVGFEGPSWVGAMMALVNMVTPKIEYCRSYGVEIDESDWPAHYAPKIIMADRGELMSTRLGTNITKHLRIDIENTSPGRADLKAIVERRFGIVPAKYKQFTPGYVEKDFGERGTRDYRLDAALDLREFTEMVILGVLEHNMQPIRGLSIQADMVTDGLTAAPVDLWQWGVINRSGSLKTLTVDEVALNVMPMDTARVTARGIRFKKGYYSCPTAIREDWFASARRDEWTVPVSFDPRAMENLYVRDSKLPRGFEAAVLLDRSEEYRGKSLYEIEEIDIAKKCVDAAGENLRQEKRIHIDKRLTDIESRGKQATREAGEPDSKAQAVAAIRNNRASEKEVQRGAESFNLTDTRPITGNDTPEVANHASASPSRNTLSLLERKRKERDGESHGP